jgi:hypothetical protein
MRKLMFLAMLMTFSVSAFSQSSERPTTKFGEIKPEDFVSVYSIDSTANAVVLFDIGKAEYGTDTKGGFAIIYKFHQRIRLMNKNGFDAATVEIPVYKGNNAEEFLEKVEAATYTLENGQVITTKVDKGSMFKDKISKNFQVQKFTFPNLKEGCIIEYTYTISSPFTQDLHEWYFQGEYPRLWSEYDAWVPTIYNFTVLNQGYIPFAVNKTELTSDNYNIYVPGETASDRGQTIRMKLDVYHTTWAMKDIPGMKSESFTTTLRNHVAKIEFQLSTIRYPNQPVKPVMRTWFQVADELMKDENFGKPLTDNNGWLSDDVKALTASGTSNIEKAKKIYAFVRDNFTCTDHTAKYVFTSLKKVFEAKKGSVAELNILLAAMLKKAGFEVHPVLLSTREHGKTYDAYPMLDRLNYVIVQAKVDDNYYLLDASMPKLGFGKLPIDCYNGSARIIAEMPTIIDLSSDSLVERKLTSIFIINSEDGKNMEGSFSSELGYYESYGIRKKLINQTEDEFFKNIKKEYSLDLNLANTKLESLSSYDDPVSVKYDFKYTPDEDILYINPLFAEATKENPFKSAKRFYPVEMPFTFNETYILDMEIPKGYVVDEIPKSARVNFNDNEGMFEYIISNDGKNIRLRSRIVLNKATFIPEDYDSLREFFAFIVKKHSEQIVLKKK